MEMVWSFWLSACLAGSPWRLTRSFWPEWNFIEPSVSPAYHGDGLVFRMLMLKSIYNTVLMHDNDSLYIQTPYQYSQRRKERTDGDWLVFLTRVKFLSTWSFASVLVTIIPIDWRFFVPAQSDFWTPSDLSNSPSRQTPSVLLQWGL